MRPRKIRKAKRRAHFWLTNPGAEYFIRYEKRGVEVHKLDLDDGEFDKIFVTAPDMVRFFETKF